MKNQNINPNITT